MKKIAILTMSLLIVSATSVQADLVGLWHLDGDSLDSSGYGNDGTVYGGAGYVAGMFGQAISIDEVDDYVEVGDASELHFGDGDSITIQAWVRPAAPTYLGVIVQKGGITSNETNYALRQDEGEQLAFFYRGTDNRWHGVRTTHDVLAVGEWNHVAATYTFGAPADAALYVEGSSQDVYWHWGDGSADPHVTGQSLRIGGSNIWDQKYYGEIDEVRIWNEALTDLWSGIVDIDIKPGSHPNSINPNAGGVIPVAILTTSDFDASTVNPETVALEGTVARGKGKSGNYGSMEDVDADGDLDLVVQIENVIEWDPEATEATLTGYTYDGIPIQGTDTVNIVPPGE